MKRVAQAGLLMLAVLSLALAAPAAALAEERRPAKDSGPAEQRLPSSPGKQPVAQEPVALLPDLRTLPPNELQLELRPGGQRWLRLGNTVWNNGAGPLALIGTQDRAKQETIVTQRITYSDGSTRDQMVGAFVWDARHGHFHFDYFALYEVWSLTPQDELLEVVARSEKLSWCIIESNAIDREHDAFERIRRYTTCEQDVQGLQPGWGDRYGAHLPGQAIDISWLPDGVYALRSTANPDALIIERSYINNTGTVLFELAGDRLRPLGEAKLEHCRATGTC
jgi:hypothetical protein